MKKWIIIPLALGFIACTGKKATPAVTTAKPAAPAPATAPQAVQAATKAPAPSNDLVKLSCVKGKDVRELEVMKDGQGCKFDYTRGGKLTVAAKSKHDVKQCENSEKKMESRLQRQKFKCT